MIGFDTCNMQSDISPMCNVKKMLHDMRKNIKNVEKYNFFLQKTRKSYIFILDSIICGYGWKLWCKPGEERYVGDGY